MASLFNEPAELPLLSTTLFSLSQFGRGGVSVSEDAPLLPPPLSQPMRWWGLICPPLWWATYITLLMEVLCGARADSSRNLQTARKLCPHLIAYITYMGHPFCTNILFHHNSQRTAHVTVQNYTTAVSSHCYTNDQSCLGKTVETF